jgi:hypothetical protein
MRRLAPDLARRIDRLSWRAHLFHRFAHHPLCREYAHEVIRIGRRGRVCKGCVLLGLGLALGAAAGLLFHVPTAAAAAIVIAGAVLAAASLFVRLPKIASRLVPGAIGGLLTASAVRSGSPADLAVVAAVWTTALLLHVGYRRRGPARRQCDACPEFRSASPCRGLAEIVRRERAFRRVSGRLIAAAGNQSFAVQ